MQNAGFLFTAFAIVWAGVFAYVLFLSGRQGKLQREVNALKEALREKEPK
ncbi:MAG: CcmD family protein [Chloroflexi bacterium]|nr:CcmD family protein [Chloroflexota bacterium]